LDILNLESQPRLVYVDGWRSLLKSSLVQPVVELEYVLDVANVDKIKYFIKCIILNLIGKKKIHNNYLKKLILDDVLRSQLHPQSTMFYTN